jgi:glycosyltransferase involved in cell wall biosynthesis
MDVLYNYLMKRKVLFVITKSNWGGAQRYVFDLATALPKDRFDVVVALGGTGHAGAVAGLLEQKLHEAGVRTILISSFMRDVSILRDWTALQELKKIFEQEKPDIVHLNSSKAGGLGALAARLAGVKKIIFTVHGLPWDENRNPVAKMAIYIATQLTFFLSHTVITISKDNYTRARKCLFFRHKIYLIYNGVGPMDLGSGKIIRDAFPPGTYITGTIGELTKNKNQQALIEEAKNDTTMYVGIVGEGEERARLEAKIKEYGLSDRVKLFGFMPASTVLCGFDRFALPSIKEGLPYVLLEARAAGLTIEANRVGGVGEILDAKDISEFSLEQMVEKTIKLYQL